MCEVLLPDMTPHETNTRALLRPVAEKFADQEPIFGIEQEYTFFKEGRPLGFPPNGFPAPQAFYYCGVGADEVFGRDVVEAHLEACLDAGLGISGINAEVMPGQWEFQVGPARARSTSPTSCGSPAGSSTGSPRTSTCPPPSTRSRSRVTGTAPVRTPTSRPRRCARATTRSSLRARRWGRRPQEHVAGTAPTSSTGSPGATRPRPGTEFSYGVSNRGASVRIPWQVEIDKKGYIEDRRPNANMDPYVVTRHDHRARSAARWRSERKRSTRHGSRFAARISWPVRRALVVRDVRKVDDPWRLLSDVLKTAHGRGGRDRRHPLLRPPGAHAALLDPGPRAHRGRLRGRPRASTARRSAGSRRSRSRTCS